MKTEVTEVTQKTVGVFCSSDDKVPAEFKTLAFNLGNILSKKGYRVLTASSNTGLMKEIAAGSEAYHDSIPEDNVTWTQSLYNRLTIFHERSSVVVVLPGGFGTLHELMDFLVHNQSGLSCVPIIVLNTDGFWDGQFTQFEKMVEKNCLAAKHLSAIKVVTTLADCIEAIENDSLHQPHWGLDGYWKKAAGA